MSGDSLVAGLVREKVKKHEKTGSCDRKVELKLDIDVQNYPRFAVAGGKWRSRSGVPGRCINGWDEPQAGTDDIFYNLGQRTLPPDVHGAGW